MAVNGRKWQPLGGRNVRASKHYIYLLNNLQWAATISHSVPMPKPGKVVPITIAKRLGKGKGRVFSVQSESHRVIFGIAERRFAFDILVSVIDLRPRTREQPTRVLLMKGKAASSSGLTV
jgi:hypothetical protein